MWFKNKEISELREEVYRLQKRLNMLEEDMYLYPANPDNVGSIKGTPYIRFASKPAKVQVPEVVRLILEELNLRLVRHESKPATVELEVFDR